MPRGPDITVYPDDEAEELRTGMIFLPASREAKEWLAWVEESHLIPRYKAQVIRMGRRDAYLVPERYVEKLLAALWDEGFVLNLMLS